MASGRICKRCGRRLNLDEHDDGGKVWQIARRGRCRMGVQRVRVYNCRLRLVGTSPVSGKTIVPKSAQRWKAIDNRYVHEDPFKPGGDLAPNGG